MARLLSIIYLSLSYFVLSVASAFASGCASDPNECTPKGLCEVATEVTDGNKLWSTSNTSRKHVSFAQELGMNCGVVELKDPCDTDPNQCKINQLCEKATIEEGGTKSWNSGAEAYVEVAIEYGLECGVKAETSETKGDCAENAKICDAKGLCVFAVNGSSVPKQWEQSKEYEQHVKEANRRGLTCGVGETKSAGGSEVFSSWSDALICKYVKI